MKIPTDKVKKYRTGIFSGVLISVLYLILFSPPVMKKIIVRSVQSATRAEISLNVKRSSLFFGFYLSDVHLYTAEKKKSIFKAERIVLSYSLMSLLIGHAGIRKLEIVKPEIFITRDSDGWNTDALTGESASLPEEEEIPGELPDFIRLYYPFKFYASIAVKDLKFIYSNPNDSFISNIEISNFNLFASVITKTITKIPLNDGIFQIFNLLAFSVVTDKQLILGVSGADAFQSHADINWFVYHDRTEKDIFHSEMHVRSRDSASPSQSFFMKYNITYDKRKDSISLKELNFQLPGGNKLFAEGEILKITEDAPEFHITLKDSRFHIEPSYSLLQHAMGTEKTPLTIDGGIQFFEMNGMPDRMSFSHSLHVNRLYYAGAGFPIYIQNLKNQSDGTIDLYTSLPLTKPDDYKKSDKLAFGLIHRMNIPALSMNFNESSISLNGDITPEKGIALDISLINLNILPFTGPDLTGYASGRIFLNSDESFSNLTADTDIKLNYGRFLYGRSLSKAADYKVRGKIGISISDEATSITSPLLSLTGNSASGADILSLTTGTNIQIYENSNVYGFSNMTLSLHMQDLFPLLPGELQYDLKPAKKILSGGISLHSPQTVYSETKTTMDVKTSMRISVPYLHFDDLNVNADIYSDPVTTNIRRLEINALQESLRSSVSGIITEMQNKTHRDLRITVDMQNNQLQRVHQNLLMQGGFHVNFTINDNAASGKILMEGLDIKYEDDNCDIPDRPECIQFYIHNLNLDLPVFHDMKYAAAKNNYFAGPVIHLSGRKANLYAQFIRSSHNPRGEYIPEGYYYAGMLSAQQPGLSGSIKYINNSLEIPWIKMLIYKSNATGKNLNSGISSSVDGRNIKMNLADLDTKNMSFNASLKISNLDLEPFLPGSSVKYDGRISADLNAKCANLDDIINQMDAKLSVHQLSPRFSGFATRIIMPDRFTARLVRGTLKIPSISLEMKEGLIYSHIAIERGGIFPGLFILPSGDSISQERVPIARFLERAKTEAGEISQELRSEEEEDQ